MSKFKGTYPASWTKEFRNQFRAARGNRCERCGHPHDPKAGYALTIHHLTNNKSECQWWNLAVLCQRCHLRIQARVEMEHTWLFEVSEWFKPHAAGFFAWRVLGQQLSEAQVAERMDELLALGLPFYNALSSGKTDKVKSDSIANAVQGGERSKTPPSGVLLKSTITVEQAAADAGVGKSAVALFFS